MKKIIVLLLVLCVAFGMTACGYRPFDTPELVTIEASQTAFLIPLVGDTSDQASFESEALLEQAKVATKEVQIPHRWVKTGRDFIVQAGEWRPSAKLIVVDRTPVTREWNSTKDSGTSTQNQAIYAESKESIGFSVGMNISAQIWSEADATTFLYSYNTKSLADIMDSEIRARVESKFVEECAKMTLNEILANKETIMTAVREDVETYFRSKGITITVLGMKDGIEYDDPAIQAAINEKFSSEQKLVTQQNDNAVALAKAEADAQVVVAKAQADADAKLIAAEAEAEANRLISESLTDELIEVRKLEAWESGGAQVPIFAGNSNIAPIVDVTGLLGE